MNQNNESAVLGSQYPKVAKSHIDELMASVHYVCHVVPGTTTTVATAILPLGHIKFTLASEISACVDPRNFDADIGEAIAKERASIVARDLLWKLEGYHLALLINQ